MFTGTRNNSDKHADANSDADGHRSRMHRGACSSGTCSNEFSGVHRVGRGSGIVGCEHHGILCGVIASGSLFATAQSVGAAGLGAAGTMLASAMGAGIGVAVIAGANSAATKLGLKRMSHKDENIHTGDDAKRDC